MKPKIVITHWVHDEVLEYLAPHFELITNQTRDTLPRDEVVSRAGDADGIMVFMPDSIDGELLDACPKLQVVAAALKGYDNFDVPACTERGIWFTMVPDLLTIPTAELTVGLMISLGRNVLPGDAYIREREFHGWRPRFYGTGLDGSCVGIIGLGAVGRTVARQLSGFECELLYHDNRRLDAAEEAALQVEYRDLDDLLTQSDFVCVILPMTNDTQHFIDQPQLAKMKAGAFLINTGRGSTVNELAVADALENGQLAGYAADVFEFEDWARADRPREIPSRLLDMSDKTIFTPHIGSAVDRVRREIAMEAARNLVSAFGGETPDGAINEIPREKITRFGG
ncbi:MAG: phosphonate dehydrogenase [Pseudomonadota bacterium]|nr:phosphonate dehydrogenase [Pseudomonadota bacterium]